MAEDGAQMHDPEFLDQNLQAAINQFHRARWIAMGALAAAVLIAITLGGIQLAVDQSRLTASCHWYRDIGTAPISLNPRTNAPSELGVRLIVDARSAFSGQGCAGSLPPASPALRHWAAVYHVPGVLQLSR